MNVFFLKKNLFFFAGLVFIISLILSIIFYHEYNFFNQNLSDLGTGDFGLIFNFGLMLTSIILFFYYYKNFAKNKNFNTLFFLFSCCSISLFGIGFFNKNYVLMHFLFAGLFFITNFIIILIDSILCIKNKKYDKNFFLNIIFLFVIFLYIFILRTPLMQKITVFSIIMWHFFYYLKKIKKTKN